MPVVILTALLLAGLQGAEPIVFWGPDSVEPGNVVLLYGNGLGAFKQVSVRSFPDGNEVTAPVIQSYPGARFYFWPNITTVSASGTPRPPTAR